MVVVENTKDVHNMVVCTLCSCYPWPTLGLPPNWYRRPLSVARGHRPARRLEGVRRRASEGRRGACLGQQRGASLPRPARAARRRRRPSRGRTRQACHPRQHDRRRPPQNAELRGASDERHSRSRRPPWPRAHRHRPRTADFQRRLGATHVRHVHSCFRGRTFQRRSVPLRDRADEAGRVFGIDLLRALASRPRDAVRRKWLADQAGARRSPQGTLDGDELCRRFFRPTRSTV